MNRLLTFFLTALLAFSVGWADEVSVTFSNLYSSNTVLTDVTIPLGNDVSITFAKPAGTAPQYYTNGTAVRWYARNTMTVASTQTITQIVLTFGSSDGSNTITTDVGSYNNGTWTGSASSVLFTVGGTSGNRRLSAVTVTYSGGSTPTEPNVYKKVTSDVDLVANKNYIIVNESNGVGMGELNTDRFGTGVTGLTISNNKVDIGGTDVMEMILGGSTDVWTFQMGENGNYLSDSNANNYTFFSASSVQSSSTDITKWTITQEASTTYIQSNYASSQYVRYNSSGLFGTYGINAQSPVALYVQYEGETATPAFTPAAGTFSEAQSVTISCTTADAVIYYTTDGTTPSVTNGTLYTGAITVDETTTIKAIALAPARDDSQVATATYTINTGGGGSGPFELVTDASTLNAGDEIIFVSSNEIGSAQAMSTTQNNNNRPGTTVEVVSGPKVTATTATQVFTLQGSSSGWYFYTGSGYIYAQSSNSNNMRTEEVADDNAKATISISNGEATVIFQGSNTRNNLRYNPNNGSPIFSCYASTSSQAKPFIYRRSGTTSTDPELAITPPTQTISDAAPASLTITGENISGNINAILATNTDWYLNPTSFGSDGGTATLTYTGRALSATNTVTAQASGATDATATVNYVADLWIVTDNGVTGDWHFDGQYGVQMTNNNGVYTADFAVTTPNTFILFARKLGDGVTWNTRYVFGPNSGGDWWLDVSGNGSGTIDTSDDDPIKIQTTGLFTITINANDGTFTITKRNINVTISPEDGTHFTGPSISGTITSNPAGTIEWSTDGTNWQNYTDGFTASVAAPGQSVTVYARSTSMGVTSDVAQATYTRDYAPAPAAPSFSMGSSAVAAGTVITITAPEGCTLYVDGQQVTNPYSVTITQGTTITAYCVNDEGTQSQTVTNTYNIAAVCNAMVEFKDNGSDATAATTWTALYGTADDNYFNAGRDYLSNGSSISRVYKGTTGLKFGNSSNGGSITFDLNTTNTEWKVSHITINARCFDPTFLDDYQPVFTVTTNNGQSQSTQRVSSSTVGGYTLDFNGSAITSITISTNYRAYLKGFTITYDCAPEVEAPVITPATGTYYEDQNVAITAGDGCTIHYTTNGSDPTTSSPVYTDAFNVACTPGSTTTIKAIAEDGEGNLSEVTTVVYTWAAPTVVIHPDSRNTTASSMSVTLTPAPAGAQVYYTTDGSTPSPSNGTLYTGPFTVAIPNVGDAVTVKAIAVMGNMSAVATATYTHVESVLDVNAPFFSPLVNHNYYGDQTLQIGCTTPNADIYYEIVEVSGTTAPSASDVDDPTHASTHYDGTPIEMTVGNSYYVKAISYVGNNPSTISEGWYTILEAPTTQYAYTNLKDFNDHCPTGVTATFLNPVQVVYHSTYTNNGEFAEFCYLRDNTDYACVYFGKRDTNNNTIFKMGDWLDGSQISGLTNIWDRNFHIQLGTNAHTVYTWPSQAIGWSEILPEDMTCDVIVAGDTISNVWGHYVHLRNTRLSNVDDYSASDPKHTGKINDGTADAYYYDKFYRWSAGTCSYTNSGTTYQDVIQCLGDYDQAFFTTKQNAGATFDVYGVVDYYSQYEPPFEMCPIDFLWAYKPQMTPATTTSYEPVTVNITATQPEWAAEGVVIYYKTEDMEEWAVYTDPITVNSTTTIQAYAEVPAEKTDGTNYNDYVRSEILTETYTIEGIEDPTISPASQVIEITTGEESVTVTVTDHNAEGSGAVTTYTVNGVEYTLEAGQSVEIVVTETTTITAVSSIVSGEHTLYSDEVSESYEFITPNGKTYDLLTTNPVVGNIYVIVNKADEAGLSTTQNANNRAGIGVTFTNSNKTVVNGNTSLAEFILESANAGRYYFREVGTQNYLCVTTNEYANLMSGAADVNAEAAATVNSSVTSGVDQSYPATITFYYDGTPRYLRYYANNRTFTTYGDATANQDIFLYGIAAPTVYDPAIDPHTQVVQVTTGDESLNVTVIPNVQNPEGAVTYYTTDGSDPRDPNSDRHVWDENSTAFLVNTNTTVKAVTGIEFGDTIVWSNVVSETYTFIGIQPPVIDPETSTYWDGEIVTVNIIPDETNPAGSVTYYTTDGSDPRTSQTRTEWTGTEFDVNTNTTVRAATCLDVDGTTVWSVVTEETYTFRTPEAWTLRDIEHHGVVGDKYTVSDQLIGAWAVNTVINGNTVKLLWVKDQGNRSIIATSNTGNYTDYMAEIWPDDVNPQIFEWDQSNWAVIDLSNSSVDPQSYVNKLIKGSAIVGTYTDALNYTIVLDDNAQLETDGNATGFYGYVSERGDPKEKQYNNYRYNNYTVVNFLEKNLNEPWGPGATAGPNARACNPGTPLFFMNPKIMEVAHVWGVYAGGNRFDIYQNEGSYNGFDLEGSFVISSWDYNQVSAGEYGMPDGLTVGHDYLFHAIVMRNNYQYGYNPSATNGLLLAAPQPGNSASSPSMGLYSLDLPNGDGAWTSVKNVYGERTIVGVSYYNLMGVESKTPFEGVNIVVTRYSDGSSSTVKVLR